VNAFANFSLKQVRFLNQPPADHEEIIIF